MQKQFYSGSDYFDNALTMLYQFKAWEGPWLQISVIKQIYRDLQQINEMSVPEN